MKKKRKILLISSLTVIAVAIMGLGIWWQFSPSSLVNQWRCLNEDENAEYEITKEGAKNALIKVSISSNNNNEQATNFEINNVRTNYHPIELHKCGAYLVKLFNFDPKEANKESGYRSEFWKYDYSGKGKKLFLLSEFKDDYFAYYGPVFYVDPFERYVVLEKGYLGKEDGYFLVVKDLATKEDLFQISHAEMSENFPEQLGVFDMRDWSRDGRYFWGSIANGAQVPAYFRIDTENWTYDIFPVPEGQMGGDQLNVDTGWVTHHEGVFFTGIYELEEQIKAEHREQGIGTKFYLYNLLTGEKILIYETDEPDWYTTPTWLSDTEVEYGTVEGERRVYELPNF